MDTFLLGNLTAPFTSTQCGLITPEEFNTSATFESQPMNVGWTFDDSSPITHAYVGCNVGTGTTTVYCNPYRLNTTGVWIGKGQALVPGKYVVTVSAKDAVTANNTVTLGFGATCLSAVRLAVPIKNTWPQVRSDYFTTIVDLSGASGNCAVAFQILGATTADQIQIGFVAYSPLPELFSANAINLLNALTLGGVAISQAATAPTGSCAAVAWVLSNDGHMTFCTGTTYVTKF